jgi:hypothetical protein
MQGRIVKFYDNLKVGVIETEDGRKYRFKPNQVVNPNGRFVGYDVDFVRPRPGGKAKDIILLTGSIFQVFADPRNGGSRFPSRRVI